MLEKIRETLTEFTVDEQAGMAALRENFEDVDEALRRVEDVLESLRSDEAPVVSEVASHLVTSGGKRLRPALLFLSYGTSGGRSFEDVEPYAAATELIHTATLLHDDVIDQGERRRGVQTAHQRFGNTRSILSGDFLVAHVIKELLGRDSVESVEELSKAMAKLVQGEILQDQLSFNLDMTPEQYRRIVRLKTSSLFAYACWAGGFLADRDRSLADHLSSYGEHLGVAFQMVDDVLDYEHKGTGKTPLSDLRKGQLNYPLILYLRENPDFRVRLETARGENELTNEFLVEVQERVRESDVLDRTRQEAQDYGGRARACLEDAPSNCYSEALRTITRYVYRRIQ